MLRACTLMGTSQEVEMCGTQANSSLIWSKTLGSFSLSFLRQLSRVIAYQDGEKPGDWVVLSAHFALKKRGHN